MSAPAVRKQDPPWAMWLGPLLGVLAVMLKAAGLGIARGAIVFCMVVPVVLMFRLWDKTPPARRPLLLYTPLALAAVITVVFFVIPTGGTSDDEITPGVCRYGYTQRGDCLPASGVVPGSNPTGNDGGAGPGDCPNPEGHDSHGYVCPGTIAPGDD